MNVEGKQACTEDSRRFLKTSETVPKPHEGSWKWSTTETKKFYVMFRNVIESYLTDFGFHGVGLNYSGLLYQILRQRCSIFFKMANLWEMNYSEFKLILPIKTDFVAWTDIAKKQEGQKLASSALSHLSLKVLSSFIREITNFCIFVAPVAHFPALGTGCMLSLTLVRSYTKGY